MNEEADNVDYIRQIRMILADSIDSLLNLQHDLYEDKDEQITPITSKAELIDMSYDLAYSQKISSAQSGFLKREDGHT